MNSAAATTLFKSIVYLHYYLTRKTITNIYANQCYNIIYLYFLATGSFNDNQMTKNTKRPGLKITLGDIIIDIGGAGIIWYLFTLTFDDTKSLKPCLYGGSRCIDQ